MQEQKECSIYQNLKWSGIVTITLVYHQNTLVKQRTYRKPSLMCVPTGQCFYDCNQVELWETLQKTIIWLSTNAIVFICSRKLKLQCFQPCLHSTCFFLKIMKADNWSKSINCLKTEQIKQATLSTHVCKHKHSHTHIHRYTHTSICAHVRPHQSARNHSLSKQQISTRPAVYTQPQLFSVIRQLL